MNLNDFLQILIQRLDEAEISYCILRNYEELPYNNVGNDLDFLIRSDRIDSALSILFTIKGIKVTGILKRAYVTNSFISGVDWGQNCRAIQIDWVHSLGWKGIRYLTVDKVLQQSQAIPKTGGLIKKPDIVHEALISFFSSYLIGGWINEKYQPVVKRVFNSRKLEIIATLKEIMPNRLATLLVHSVTMENRKDLLKLLPKIRYSLLLNKFRNSPFDSIKAVIGHFLIEFRIRYLSYPVTTICFLGPDGSGKTSVIKEVADGIRYTTKEIVFYHLKPAIKRRREELSAVTDPHGKPPRSALVSTGKVLFWLLLYWYDRLFYYHKNLTIRIWDRYYYDLLIDPRRYRYNAPMWLSKLIAKLVPKPDLVILLDAPATVLQGRKREVSFEETKRQRTAYLRYVSNLKNGIVIDAAQPLYIVASASIDAIIQMLSKRTQKSL